MQEGLSNPATMPSMEELAAGIAPLLIDSAAPQSEATAPAAGSTTKAQGAGHKHERLTSAQYATTKADGTTDPVMFTRSFATKPCAILTPINSPGTDCDVVSWVRETMTPSPAGAYVGAVLRATTRNANTTPSLVTVLNISVVGGITTSTASAPVANCEMSVVMLAQSG